MRTLQLLTVILVIAGCAIFFYFLNKSSIDGYSISNSLQTDYQISGQFGDFVGGVVGTLFALSGTILIYMNFREQTKENKRSAFEASFFEMIRLHRENIGELKYEKSKIYENRQVPREIYKEFIECYREVRKFSNSRNQDDYFNKRYKERLQSIISETNRQIDPIELAAIDIAYMIVFYGLSSEGEQIIKNNIKKKYNPQYYFKLLFFIRLKPKTAESGPLSTWEYLAKSKPETFHQVINDLYKNRKDLTKAVFPISRDFSAYSNYEKYYGGHQFRLGHYFRHLYQSFKYLNNHSDLTAEEKYSYAKLFRAQISTYEQALIFINSLSNLGMKWELCPEKSKIPSNTSNLITKYNIIKNLPGTHISGISFRTYYPDVNYETDEQINI